MTQCPLQSVSPLTQRELHWLAEQAWPAGQAAPHPPQLALSFGLMHWPEQSRSPETQVAAQARAEQTFPEAHATAQAPQFALLLVRSTQVPPHWTWSNRQVLAQVPLLQTRPELQGAPQAPQFSASLSRLTQTPEQRDSPPGHAGGVAVPGHAGSAAAATRMKRRVTALREEHPLFGS